MRTPICPPYSMVSAVSVFSAPEISLIEIAVRAAEPLATIEGDCDPFGIESLSH